MVILLLKQACKRSEKVAQSNKYYGGKSALGLAEIEGHRDLAQLLSQ